ncbi:Hypothetical protein Tpal_134 [Trichococcus palustris]|uniref:Uncharacterized protein n=2 Tax=Trichococcus palustris TaxID=140314 RepID=A0A143Y5U5_9LACT|nr:Hypothetical protein Tpal_134 [Trichococcus palustris]SFK63628.1 Flp pilus assembly protein TadG [Trichococcus palustris]
MLLKLIKRLKKEEQGQALIMVALMLTVLLGFAALVVDVGNLYVQKSQLQNAADAAALAGAQDLGTAIDAEATAKNYAEANGVPKTETLVDTTYDNNPSKIEVVSTKNVSYTFARVLGLLETNVKARAVAQKATEGGDAFNYAVFAGGGALTFTGGKHIIGGSVYGRNGVSFNGSGNEIDGDVVSSTSTANVSGTITGDTITNNPVIPMPDFSNLIKAQATICTTVAEFNNAVAGTDDIYFIGNLTITARIPGDRVVVATGNITANSAAQTSADSVTFYSINGNITFNGGTSEIYGILYAPNGTVTDNGGPNGHINGRIIAKIVDVNGAKFSVDASSNDLDSLSKYTTVKLIE